VSEHGYSLVELLVSVAIMLTVLASVCQLASPAHATALVQAEQQDMQQRARVLADRLTFDVRMAGANTTTGTRTGAITSTFAPILPLACCGSLADPPGSVRTDRLTILYVPRGSPMATTGGDVAPGALQLDLAPASPCGTPPLCGFADGDVLVISDGAGCYDVFRLDLSSGVPMLTALSSPFTSHYAIGATVARVTVRTYLRDSSSDQVLVVQDGGAPEPLVDRVADLRFEYQDDSGGTLDGRLGDGPWVGAGASMYDADLRAVRRVRVSYSIRSGLGGTGALAIPDLTSSFEVVLRN